MTHHAKCQKCGHEYVTDAEAHTPKTDECNACGAELYDSHTHLDHEDSAESEHPIEKGLRKVTDEITGNKTKV